MNIVTLTTPIALPWRVTAVAPGEDGRWVTLTDSFGTQLEALAEARQLALEALPDGGTIRVVPCSRKAMQALVVAVGEGELYAVIVLWGKARSTDTLAAG
jgi:hypothetical protein